MFVSGVCESVRTNQYVTDGGIVLESVLELEVETELGPVAYCINSATAEVGCMVSVKCCWVQLSEEQGYWSAHPMDMIVFGKEEGWLGEDDLAEMESVADAPF